MGGVIIGEQRLIAIRSDSNAARPGFGSRLPSATGLLADHNFQESATASLLLELAETLPRLLLELTREYSRPSPSCSAESTSEPPSTALRFSGRTEDPSNQGEHQSNRPHVVETRFGCDRLLPGSVEIVKHLSDGSAQLVGSLQWQQGPSRAVGVNGCEVEDVLELCRVHLDRWQQHTEQPDSFGAVALRAVESAILALEGRALDRAERGVVG